LEADVPVTSIHCDPRLTAPFYAGFADAVGKGEGGGCNLNLPLRWATADEPWIAAIDTAIQQIKAFQTDALVVSLGLDASESDSTQTFKITGSGFAEAARRLRALSYPTFLVQEGGYLSPALGGYLRGFLAAFESRA
jgi:acetoin utilization deacetylase AcuC-like enzyme